MKFRTSILDHFGVVPKPYHGKVFKQAATNLIGAIQDGLFTALICAPGTGKKTLIRYVIDHLSNDKHHIIYIQLMEDARITIGQIMARMIDVLRQGNAEESPRRDAYARKMQLARLLGIATNDGWKVTLIIEQAQHLHSATIRATKELGELSFLGKTDMFGVLLSGHVELKGKIKNLKDVSSRVEIEELNEEQGWMTMVNRVEYLKGRFGNLLTEPMRQQIASEFTTPLEMDGHIRDKSKEVFLRGDTAFKASDFMYDLKSIVQEYGLEYKDIGDAVIGKPVSKSTVSEVINGNYDNPATIKKVKEAIAVKIEEKKTSMTMAV